MAKENRINSFYNRIVKRLLDVFFSFLSIVILAPIIIVFIIVNCFFTGFCPFFAQKRCGRNKKPFYIIKLRTLTKAAPDYEEKSNPDNYTKIGFFLRKTHIDELPQLLNIFIGQMSFIGPRPIICTLEKQISNREIDGTISLRPGLSGLAQINERDMELTQEEKCKFDKIYLENISFGYDFKIALKSVGVVFINMFRKRPATR